MAKLNIDFVLLDETVVEYGYRCLMSGAELQEFIANPVMLVMHLRATGSFAENPHNDILLPIGRWYDIRVEDGKLKAKPEFDDDDELAIKVQKKVERGYLNAASVWLKPIAVSNDEALKLAGQSGPTLTRWGVRETSIVDVPGCRNAIAIRDDKGKLLKLNSSDSSSQQEVIAYLNSLIPNSEIMDKKNIAIKLGLTESATDSEITERLSAAISQAAQSEQLTTENKHLKDKIVELQGAQDKQKIDGLIDGAIASGKLAAGERDEYYALALSNFDATKKIIDRMKPYESLESKLSNQKESNAVELSELMKLTGRELYMQGKLSRLQELSAEHFKLKYREAFGTDYKG